MPKENPNNLEKNLKENKDEFDSGELNMENIFDEESIKTAAEKPTKELKEKTKKPNGITEPPQETTEQDSAPEQAETPESPEKDLSETAEEINEQIDEKVEELQESGEHFQQESQKDSTLLPPERDEIQKAVQEANAEGQQTADTAKTEIEETLTEKVMDTAQDKIQNEVQGTETKIETAKNVAEEKEKISPAEDVINELREKNEDRKNEDEGDRAEKEAEEKMKFDIQAKSIPGEKRLANNEKNEDALLQDSIKGFFGVFDGMGGLSKGELVSRSARDYIGKELEKLSENLSVQETAEEIKRIVEEAHQELFNNPETQAGGATASVVKILPGENGEQKMIICNVGDSRVYIEHSDGTLELVTVDDNFISTLPDPQERQEFSNKLNDATSEDELLTGVAEGSREEMLLQIAWNRRNEISQHLGQDITEKIEPRINTIDLKQGDKIIVTSDGIHDNLTTKEISQILNESKDNQEAVAKLIDEAKARSKDKTHWRHKDDDMSVIVITNKEQIKAITEPTSEPTEAEKAKEEEKQAPGDKEKETEKPTGETEKTEAELAEKIKETEISPEWLVQDFQEKFNIKQEDLEKIEGWQDLSLGQQALVLENLKQITLGRIEEEAAGTARKETAEAKMIGTKTIKALDFLEENRITKAGLGLLRRTYRTIFKKYYAVKAEKATAEDLQKGGTADHGEFLSQLVSGLKENGPGVKITKQGALEIQFASGSRYGLENLNEQQTKQVENFNKAADAFSKVPYEWGLGTASKKQREEFNQIKQKYEKTKAEFLKLEKEQLGDEFQAILAVSEIEKNIQLNQFLNTNPEIEERLQNIKSQSAFEQTYKSIIGERGLYMGGGFVTRTTAIGLLGWLGAPLAAAGIGGLIAKKRSKETLKEQEKLGRKGVSDIGSLKAGLEEKRAKLEPFLVNFQRALEEGKTEEAKKAFRELSKAKRKLKIGKLEKRLGKAEEREKNFVDATGLTEKIEKLALKIDRATSETEKKKLRGLLDTRLDYTQEKINEGLVDFGSAKERLANQYELMKKMSEGEAIALFGEKEIIKSKSGKTLNERLDQFLTFKGEKISQAQKKYVRNQVIKGASFGFVFASLGLFAREAIGAVSGGGGGGSNIPETPTRKGILAGTAENIKAKQSPGAETATSQPRIGTGSTETETIKEPVVLVPKTTSLTETETVAEQTPVAPKSAAEIADIAKEPSQSPSGAPKEIEELSAATKSPTSPSVETKIGYQGGKSIWQEAEKQLTARFQEKFEKLGGADPKTAEVLKTYNIDRLKDTVVQNPQDYGLPKGIVFEKMSDEQIKNINWDKAVDDTFGVFEKRPDLTTELTKGQIENIIENNTEQAPTIPKPTAEIADITKEPAEIPSHGPEELPATEKSASITEEPPLSPQKPSKPVEAPRPESALTEKWQEIKQGITEDTEEMPPVDESQPYNPLHPEEITVPPPKEPVSKETAAALEEIRKETGKMQQESLEQRQKTPPEEITDTTQTEQAPPSEKVIPRTIPEAAAEIPLTDEQKFFESIAREVEYDLQNYEIELPPEIKQSHELTETIKSVKEQIEGLRTDIKAGVLEPAGLTPEKLHSNLSLIEQLQNKISLQEAAKQLKLVNEKLTNDFNISPDKIDNWQELQKIAQENPRAWEQHKELLQYKILLLEKKTIKDYVLEKFKRP